TTRALAPKFFGRHGGRRPHVRFFPFGKQRARVRVGPVRAHYFGQRPSRGHGVREHHPRGDGPAYPHSRRPPRRRRTRRRPEQLEVDWSNVRISAVDPDPKGGLMFRGGSKSVSLDFPVYSRAGAAGRIALIEAGAKLLGVSPPQCVARQGAVVAANRSISYGE